MASAPRGSHSSDPYSSASCLRRFLDVTFFMNRVVEYEVCRKSTVQHNTVHEMWSKSPDLR